MQCRDDDPVVDALTPLHDASAALPVRAERELLRLVDGGCSLPFGAWAQVAADGRLTLVAVLESDHRLVRVKRHGTSPEELAARVWEALEADIGDGAAEVVDAPGTAAGIDAVVREPE